MSNRIPCSMNQLGINNGFDLHRDSRGGLHVFLCLEDCAVVGNGQVIKGFDDALLDMTIGEKKKVNIPVDHAYGHSNDDMMMEYPVSDFPADMTPEVGMELQMGDNQGNVFQVIITEVNDDMVLLDANHPLAGQDLIFDIELVSIG